MLNISKRFFSKCRPEAKTLRKTLIANYSKHPLGCHCSLCLSKYPLELLDMSHLKPRSVLKHKELRNISNVELMCKTCHSLYDGGIISIDTN
jgi:predicted restriction endonuclease